MPEIQLPYNWSPRPYQKKFWDYLSSGGKRAVARWHRRAGKDDICLHHIACASQERVGNYWYCLPQYSQARKAMWEAVNPNTGKRRIFDAFPREMIKTVRENEMNIVFHNGSTFQLVGSDNPDSLVGSPPIGIVFSEYSLSNPSTWAYLMPILEENHGWAVFNGTPRGKNHFKKMCDLAEKSQKIGNDWYYDVKTADDTEVFNEKQLKTILEELQDQYGDEFGMSMWMQEYYVSFDAAIMGSIYGEFISRIEHKGQILDYEVDPQFPVNTAWDLGRTDATAIWFYQVIAGEIRVIDYYQDSLKEIPEYAGIIRKKAIEGGYGYATHWLPHDARPKRLGMGGKSIMQQLQDEKIGRMQIVPRYSIQDGIAAARATLPKVFFHKTNCETGLEMLRSYHYEYNEEKKIFTDSPMHDWTSHGADAFRYMALSWRNPKVHEATTSAHDKLLQTNVVGMNFGKLKKDHLAKMKNRRNQLYH